jgi:DNA-directed RNA polymerase sigma subunit (sigma70/sigma32)
MLLSGLINERNLSLIKAGGRFNETRGFKFFSFAVWWIRQTILAAITENARKIRLPMNKVHDINRINRATSSIERETLLVFDKYIFHISHHIAQQVAFALRNDDLLIMQTVLFGDRVQGR